MRGARPVLLILFLLAGSLSPPCARAQEPRARAPAQSRQGFFLDQNYPNPVSSSTYIPFVLEESLFEESDSAIVTLRVVNILSQVVAFPTRSDTRAGRRERIFNLPYTRAGRYVVFWDGRNLEGRQVPSGVYYAQLTVNNRLSGPQKIVVLR